MFEIGQKVLCVDDRPRYGGPTFVTAGCVYTVESTYISSYPPTLGAPCVMLVEVPLDDGSLGWYADRFRPIDDPAIEQFREMARNPQKEKERERESQE